MTDSESIRRRVQFGERISVRLPHSEVCMHMRIAGQVREVELFGGKRAPLVRVHLGSGYTLVLPGEAGFHCDRDGWYAYEVAGRAA